MGSRRAGSGLGVAFTVAVGDGNERGLRTRDGIIIHALIVGIVAGNRDEWGLRAGDGHLLVAVGDGNERGLRTRDGIVVEAFIVGVIRGNRDEGSLGTRDGHVLIITVGMGSGRTGSGLGVALAVGVRNGDEGGLGTGDGVQLIAVGDGHQGSLRARDGVIIHALVV